MDGGPTLLENMTTLGMRLSTEQTHAGATSTQELMIVISNLTSYVSYGVKVLLHMISEIKRSLLNCEIYFSPKTNFAQGFLQSYRNNGWWSHLWCFGF